MKVFVQRFDDRFVNNVSIVADKIGLESYTDIVANNIYKLHYVYSFDIYVLVADLFNNEIAQFISEYHNQNVKFFIYHTNLNKTNDILKDFGNACTNISWQKPINGIQIPNNIINTEIYRQENVSNKEDFCTYFMDIDQDIPDNISKYLYPNSKLPIRMFNNSNILHYQNLGLLTEQDKAEVLKKSKYYLHRDDNYYSLEAVACGCCLVNTNNISKNQQDFIIDIDNTNSIKSKLSNCITYKEFMTNIIYGKK